MSDTPPRAVVVGWPVTHVRSPVIHRFWLKEMGLPGFYDAQALSPDDARAFFRNLPHSGLAGCNVTVPLKEIAAAACDVLDPVADGLKAVNTMWLDGRYIMGANTDVGGFLDNLDDALPDWSRNPGPAVVLGAGGAARAVAYGLKLRLFSPIAIVNRTPDRAAEVAALVRGTAYGWDALPKLLADARILVNTTTLGQVGQPPLEIDLSVLPRSTIVTDVVYNPLETGLLKAARARGNPVADGLGMLLYQAVPGFTRWFGHRPEVTPALRRAVLATLVPPAG
jgi:shikimate dehydrogenase